MLSGLRAAQARGEISREPLEISATGDISSGRIAVEYALRGCTSFQIHTLFQLPAEAYAMRTGPKVARALHRLYFDPADGFIVWAATPPGGWESRGRTVRSASSTWPGEARSHASRSGTSTPSALSSAIRPGVSR